MKPAVKKYLVSLTLGMGSYMFILFGVNTYLTFNTVPQGQATFLALLPMLAVFLIFKAIAEFARSWDELQRKKAMEAMLISFLFTGFGTFAYGFLEGVGFPRLEIIWVLPIMFAMFGVGQILVARRY
jgi:hypothetical protein